MAQEQVFGRGSRATARLGFTLIELLVSIAIIAVLASILVPTLGRAREEARKVFCMSNLKEIGAAINSYRSDNDNLPWTYVHPSGEPCPGAAWWSSYTWGGMRAPMPLPGGESGDWALVPAELRPLNRFLAPTAQGKDMVKVVECPGDRSAVSPEVDAANDGALENEGRRSSWEAFGSSYSINWVFMNAPNVGEFSFESLMANGKLFVQEAVGGSAAEMVVIWENQVDQLLVNATDTGGGRLGEGWHRRFSQHSFLFMDAHTEHGFYDTRFSRGTGWRVWRK
jgi:prepilin-type N-terminal cleavage/methylation domain-containing protein